MQGMISNSEYLADKRLPLRVVKRDPQEEYQLHNHEFSELVIVCRGAGEQVIYGENRTIEAGDVFLIRNRTKHGYTKLKDLALYNLMFDMRELNNPLQAFCRYPAVNSLFYLEPDRNSAPLLHLNPEELEHVLELVRAIEEEQECAREHYPLAMAAHFVLLTVQLGRYYSAHKLSGGKKTFARISELINRMTEESERPWTRLEMARSIMVSESTLTRMFKSHTGYAPNEYLIILRLKKSAVLLLNTELSIGEIADQCGFADSNYFCRQFRRHFRIPPKKYRLENQKT